MTDKGLGSIFKNISGVDPTLGVAGSQTAQAISENLNLGSVVDSMNPDAMSKKIKAGAIADVIKYEGDNNTFIWKHPIEDFNIGTQLIVHESQEAIFYMNGQALDLFGPGRHTLETQNLPFVGKFFSAATGGRVPFHCEIYFINKTEQMEIKWGTDSKLEYMEPTYHFPIQIGASGAMSLRVEDSRKLLVKIVGTEKGISNQGFVQKMRSLLMTRVKNYLASYIKTEKISIFEIDEHLESISLALHEHFRPDFMGYGIAMERFFVTTIVKPEDDSNYQKFREMRYRQYQEVAEAELRKQTGVIDAQRMAQERAVQGYTYEQEQGFDVAKRLASNEAVGQMANMGVGLGIMAGVSGTVGSTVGGLVQNTMGSAFSGTHQEQQVQPPQNTMSCEKCGNPLPQGAKFCLECGQQVLLNSEIICPFCGVKTLKGKFCLECGAALEKKCPECGTEIPPNGKFCLECGHKI